MAIDEAKRCGTCGRPIPGSGEPLLPREIECQGCHAHATALKAEKKPLLVAVTMPDDSVQWMDHPDGLEERAHTDGQIRAMAFNAHADRELRAWENKRILQLRNIAAGKDADTGVAKVVGPIYGTAQDIEDGKRSAQAMLDAIDAKIAFEAANAEVSKS